MWIAFFVRPKFGSQNEERFIKTQNDYLLLFVKIGHGNGSHIITRATV